MAKSSAQNAKKPTASAAKKSPAQKQLERSLEDHANRAFGMILCAAKGFSEAEWFKASSERMTPARIVHHILQTTERYTWLGKPAEYAGENKGQFPLDWEDTPTSRDFLGRDAACEHLEQARLATLEWIAQSGDGLLTGKPIWPWTGGTKLAQFLYLLRHLQHHMAELNAELHRRSLPVVDWP